MAKELKGVEIWGAGKTLDGRDVTEQDVQDVVDSYQEIGQVLKPFVKLGHNEEQSLLEKDGLPAGGWISRVYRVGKTVLADIVGVPDALYQAVKAKAYRRVSSEVFHNIKVNGKVYRRALRAVAFLGGDTPAVGSLSDILALGYASDADVEVYETEITQEDQMKKCPECGAEMEMDAVRCHKCGKEMKKFEADGIKIDVHQVDVEAIKKAEADKYAADLKAKDEALAAAEAKIAQYEAEKKQAEESARVAKFEAEVDGLTESGKLPPALKGDAIAIFKALEPSAVVKYSADGEEKEENLPAMFSAFLAKAAKLDAFRETLPNKGEEFKAGDCPENVDPESFALDQRIKKYMADNKIDDYAAAYQAVRIEMSKEEK